MKRIGRRMWSNGAIGVKSFYASDRLHIRSSGLSRLFNIPQSFT